MECPSCSSGCSLIPSEGDKGFYCSQCDGLWLAKETLNSLCEVNKLDSNILRKKLREERRVDNSKACPNCVKTLATSAVNNMELDWCETCDGVWFDRGECQRILSGTGKISILDKATAVFTLVEFIGLIFSGLS